MGKKKVIKSGAPSLADLPRDIRNLIADYVEETWAFNKAGKRWNGTSTSSFTAKVKALRNMWCARRRALDNSIWFMSISKKLDIRNKFDDSEVKQCEKQFGRMQSFREKQLAYRKTLAYRQGLLIRKCKRAVA